MHTFLRHARIACDRIVSKLEQDGSFGPEAHDLLAYYKAPYLLGLLGHTIEAQRVLDFIQQRFMRPDGDFFTAAENKSSNPLLTEFWGYPNAWIAMGAQRLGRFDIAQPAWEYLKSFHHPQLKGFTAGAPFESGEEVTDIVSTAHLGHLALYMGDLELARGAGRYLNEILDKQPDSDKGLFIRQDGLGDVITRFPEDASFIHYVSASEPGQAYFVVGYAMGFLAKLFLATGRQNHLETANAYGEWALECRGNIDAFPFSHKVMWGSALLASITGDQRYKQLAERIGSYLVDIQTDEGFWHPAEGFERQMDQTAEIAVWLTEATADLAHSLEPQTT